jgi:hypothetical protein
VSEVFRQSSGLAGLDCGHSMTRRLFCTFQYGAEYKVSSSPGCNDIHFSLGTWSKLDVPDKKMLILLDRITIKEGFMREEFTIWNDMELKIKDYRIKGGFRE